MKLIRSIGKVVIEKARKLASARATSVSFDLELRRLTAEGKGRMKGWRFDRESLHERLKPGGS